MGVFDRVLQRLGLARLGQYGLVITAEDRVLSLRPGVLDDGLGGKIVGWRAADLAAMELESLQILPAPRRAMTPPPAIPPAIPRRAIAAVAIAPVIVSVSAPVSVGSMPVIRAVPPPPPVAPAPEVEDDDWEWVIAVARAKAVAEDEVQTTVGDTTQVDVPLAAKPVFVGRAPLATKLPRLASGTAAPGTVLPAKLVPLRPSVQLNPISRRPIRAAR